MQITLKGNNSESKSDKRDAMCGYKWLIFHWILI